MKSHLQIPMLQSWAAFQHVICGERKEQLVLLERKKKKAFGDLGELQKMKLSPDYLEQTDPVT